MMEGLREDVILERIANAIGVLESRPRDALARYEHNAVAVQEQLQTLVANLSPVVQNDRPLNAPGNEVQHNHNQAEILQQSTFDAASFGILHMSNVNDRCVEIASRQPESNIERLMLSALSRFTASRSQLLQLSSSSFNWFLQDKRLDHLQLIFTLQRSGKARSVQLRDRLLLICACMLLADGFRDYEIRNGWASKQDILVTDVLRGDSPRVQKIGKHLRNYTHALDSSFIDERKVDAGVRLGTKLNVLNAIGYSQGLGSTLTLVLAFEISQVSRLAYSDMTDLAPLLSSQRPAHCELKSAGIFAVWWDTCRERYAQEFSPEPQQSHSIAPHGRRQLAWESFDQNTGGNQSLWGIFDTITPVQSETSENGCNILAGYDSNQGLSNSS